MATLMLELALTRIFSVIFYYHFAFLAISIALFGLGAGGVFSYVVVGWKGGLYAKLGALAGINSVLVVASLAFLLSRTGEPGNVTLALIYFASALPFFVAGAIVSMAISETIERVDRVYFFDLVGAAGGCLILIPLLNGLGGPNTVVSVAVLFAVSSAIWYKVAGLGRHRVLAVLLAVAAAGVVIANAKKSFLDIRFAKGQEVAGELFVKWNSFSRIAVTRDKTSSALGIVIDADASTGIVSYDFDHLGAEERSSLLGQGPGLPYVLRPRAKTLIIGPGGGWDVARALASGSRDITGVEINPIIANTVMRERLPHLSRRLYFRPEVRIIVEDGRSFVRRSSEKYQVLQATLVDTWASTAAGAFALSENNLYTTDAFYDYLSHLTDDGLMAFSRWGFEPPRESLRLLSLAREALARIGERRPSRHVIVIREGLDKLSEWGALDTVMISRKPFTEDDLTRIRLATAQTGLQIAYVPGDPPANAFGQLLRAPDIGAFESEYPFDVTPVSDNRPFFFYTVQPRDLWSFITTASRISADYKINRAVPLLFGLVGVSVLATAVILTMPPLVLRTRLPRDQSAMRMLWYFVAIGTGYILIQVALIQKFVLFLGHPTYALTVIIFSMLVSSGLGSYFSRRVTADGKRIEPVLGLIAIIVTILAFVATPLTTAAVGWPLALKIVTTALLIAPAGFLMGTPFPIGLTKLEQLHKPSVRWAWSLNAASSVMGSAAAIFLAIYIGLRETLLVGGLLYIGALLVVRKSRSREGTTLEEAEVLR